MPNPENNNNQIAIRDTGGLSTSSEYKPHPIKTRIMANVLSLTQVKKYQIGGYELNEPDYLWVVQTYDCFKDGVKACFEEIDLDDSSMTTGLDVFAEKLDPKVFDGSVVEMTTNHIDDYLSDLFGDVREFDDGTFQYGIISYFKKLDFEMLHSLEKLEIRNNYWFIHDIDLKKNLKLKEFGYGCCVFHNSTSILGKIQLPQYPNSLRKIVLEGGCSLSILDLSTCENLEIIDLSDDYLKIEQLVLPSKLSSLKQLWLYSEYCILKTLDLRTCENLENLFLEINCGQIDLLIPNNLNSLQLLSLDCNCYLETLDLSNCDSLKKLFLGYYCDVDELILPYNLANITTLHCTTKQKEYLEETNQLKNVKEIIIIDEE